MTALHPLKGQEGQNKVRGVIATRYPINETCGHPDCDKPTESRHHIFPAGGLSNRAWFVALDGAKVKPIGEKQFLSGDAIPHVIGLCGDGTRGHHGDLEEHRLWIKYHTEDGLFYLYERVEHEVPTTHETGEGPDWKLVGPLDPQPGARIKHKRPKKRDRRSDGKPRNKSRYTFAVPKDEQEDGAELIDDVLDQLEAILNPEEEKRRSRYYTLIDGLNLGLLSAKESA